MVELSSKPNFHPRALRIGLDGRNVFLAEGTGIATYAKSLAGENTEWLIDAYPQQNWRRGRPTRYTRAVLSRWRPISTRVEGNIRLADDAFRVAQVHFDLFRRLLELKGRCLPDVMHWTSPLPLRLTGVPNLYTILDTIPLDHNTRTDPRRFLRILQAIAVSADHVVTLSDAAQRDIIRWLPGLAGRISVVRPSVSVVPLYDSDVREILAALALRPGGYYLFTGTIEPRKNVAALVGAFLAANTSRILVLAGPEGWRGRDELAQYVDAIESGLVRCLGYLPRASLNALMQGARALLFPSLAEGFGLPVIESMALGTPVLTSLGGATEEAAGGAALLVDPKNPTDLRAGIHALETDDGLCDRLAALGVVRAAQFGPGQQADQMAAIYQSLLAAKSTNSVKAQVM